MCERNMNFDEIIDRKNTNSLKFDFAERRGMPKDIIPFWVADMDFRISSYIQDALIEQAQHGIYGYSEVKEKYFEAVSGWFREKHGWETDIRWLVKTPGVVFALAMAVKAFTEPGDGVLIQLPVYYPFSEVIEDNGRKVVSNTLVVDESGYYSIDFEDFESKIVTEKIKLFMLCNPHNPSGRVFTREELERLGDICVKHGVIVISDEIHGDLVWEGRHIVFASVKPEFADISITCTSPSKTFNIAGLQVSNNFISNRKLKHALRRQIDAAGYSQLNAAGLAACEAAYRHGGEWYEGVKNYIKANIDFTYDYIKENIPELKMRKPEGTYLVWIDFRGLGISDREIDSIVIKKANLWLDSGAIFGEAGAGFQRINVACPREFLKDALDRLEKAVHGRQ